MKSGAKISIIAILIAAIVILSSIYVVFFYENNETDEEPDESQDEPDEGNETDDEQNESEEEPIEYQSYVFIEDGTFTTCEYCVNAGKILHELYESNELPMYYVSMVKENEAAKKRIEDDLSIYAYPTVYFDGGYEVIIGGKKENSDYEEKINSALSRDRPKIHVNVTSEWDKNESTIEVSGFVKNLENESSYSGTFKIYLTEIISTTYRDWEGNAYHFAFLDYLIEEEIEISSESFYNFSESFDSTDYDPENLKIFAVVFSAESEETYSDPEDQGGTGEHTFDAYYVDGVGATDVVEGGNTPPAVGISLPLQGKIHFRGKPILDIRFSNTFVIGKTMITADVEDDGEITKVEFYLDGELLFTDEEAPYEYEIKKIGMFRNLIRKHTITVKAYDDQGKTSEAPLEIIAIWL